MNDRSMGIISWRARKLHESAFELASRPAPNCSGHQTRVIVAEMAKNTKAVLALKIRLGCADGL